MSVRHTHRKHPSANREEIPRKKANLGHKTVAAHACNKATPSPELDKVYELNDFANQLLTNQLLKPPPGSLIHFSSVNHIALKSDETHFMWQDLVCSEGSTYVGLKTQNIKLRGLDHESSLQKFLKDGEVVFSSCLFDLEVLENGSHALNKITYNISVLTNDYFDRLKKAEGELTPVLPGPLLLYVLQYIS
jgi:hypothetical protein